MELFSQWIITHDFDLRQSWLGRLHAGSVGDNIAPQAKRQLSTAILRLIPFPVTGQVLRGINHYRLAAVVDALERDSIRRDQGVGSPDSMLGRQPAQWII